MSETCETCRHWHNDPDDLPAGMGGISGYCRRYPPVLVEKSLSDWRQVSKRWAWRSPVMYSDDTCGEWQQPTVEELPPVNRDQEIATRKSHMSRKSCPIS